MTCGLIYPGSTITLQTVVKVGAAVTDASAITFQWNIGTNGIKTITPTKIATGTYTAQVTLPTDQTGFLRYRWDTEGVLDTAEEGVLLVEPTSFGFTTTRDYT